MEKKYRSYFVDQLNYNQWANLRLISSASKLSDEDFCKTVTSSFASIQKTFIHIIWAEELWLERWQGRSFISALDSSDYPTLESIKIKLEDLYLKQLHFFEALKPGEENQHRSYLNFMDERWEFRLRDMVKHMLFHSAYHRGQLVTILRQLGKKPCGTDYLLYVDELSR